MRFKKLEDGEDFNDIWKESLQDVESLVSSFWVFPSENTEYYPLYDGKYWDCNQLTAKIF